MDKGDRERFESESVVVACEGSGLVMRGLRRCQWFCGWGGAGRKKFISLATNLS